MRKFLLAASLLFSILTDQVCNARWEHVAADPVPPVPAHRDQMPARLAQDKAVEGLMIGSFKVVLGETSLDDIRELMGPAAIQAQGDGGESEFWLCYTVRTDPVPERIWFISSEMGGSERVTSVRAIAAEGLTAGYGCPTPSVETAIHFSNGIWLGSAADTVVRRLGMAPEAERDWWSYGHIHSGTDEYDGRLQEFTTLNLFEVRIEQERVREIQASEVSAY